ncbi:DUF6443 domain-containing protein [Zunongwangia pacifica]|uniref:DUF6443 domain-containing protein n=1 Tax=Zunongwangia pacifica TaxID=2911062 RepID=A0A9X1ZXX3_9FLAO|nr:DUF6443 domain-containing protein [Zunongwangia pacifica]MCL6220603.1 DUF6443 domain-containing protein [Zunongwangia pacifica]
MRSTKPAGYVANPNDCDDTDPNIGVGTYYYQDQDNDGFGDPNGRRRVCSRPSGYVSNSNDNCPSMYGLSNGCPVSVEAISSEDFESGLGGWQQISGDNMNWTRRSGSTPSYDTGPTNAAQGSYYIYLEATSNIDNRGLLISPFFNIPQNHDLHFNYHMYGDSMGNLKVEISTNGVKWFPLWSISGDQGNNWHKAIIDLSAYGGTNSYIRFNGLIGSTYRSDIAIDNIGFSKDPNGLSSESAASSVYTRSYRKAYSSPLNNNEITPDKATELITYFDGLGRPIQKIEIKQADGIHDIITHIGYDDYGRQDKTYLPYVETNGIPGSYRGNVSDETKAYYKLNYSADFSVSTNSTANAYSEMVFEASSLNRVIAEAAPGDNWKVSSGNTINKDYQSNASGEVRLYKVSLSSNFLPSLSSSGYYSPGELYKTVIKDENWSSGKLHTSEEFKDKQRRVVLKRTYGPSDKNMDGNLSSEELILAHDTYYVYDDFGNLTYVLPPKAEGVLGLNSSQNQDIIDGLCYQYRYDGRKRLVEKQLPGKGREYIVYNKLGQAVLTQDQNLNSLSRWLFTKYDAFGRVAYTGYRNMGYDRSYLQGQVDDGVYASEYVSRSGKNNYDGIDVYYTSLSIPTSITKLFTVNYYDDYNYSPSLSLPSSSQGQTIIKNGNGIKGLATGSLIRVLGTDHWIERINGYDTKGRLIYAKEKNPYLGTVQTTEHLLDHFTGEILKTKTTSEKNGSGTIVLEDYYTYDFYGRLLTHNQCIGGDCNGVSDGVNLEYNSEITQATSVVASNSITLKPGFHALASSGGNFHGSISATGKGELIVENSYHALGQLISKKVGNTQEKALQHIDYSYNIRGWLTGINDIGSLDKLFNFKIAYDDPTSDGDPLYNGNISQTQWRTDNTDSSTKTYTYDYDGLNRIRSGRITSSNNQYNDRYNLSGVQYDKNRNITRLVRKGSH